MRALKAVGFCVAIWLVTLAAFFTYFHDYNEPADVFWDENYHLTSAEKYLNGVFFLETHPPMGKFFLALGEWILEPNGDLDKSDLLTVDKLEEDLPNGFSFYGYRFFPAVMAFLNAPLLFIAFFKLSRSTILSALLTVPYVFDNALVVHFRGAMLDAMQVFFILLAILCFLFAFSRKQFDWKYVGLAILFGIFTGMAAMTKENGLILCVLGGVIAIRLRHWKKIAIASSGFLAGVAIPVFLGWYLHFNLGERFATDYEYEMSESAAAIVHRGEAGELRNFFQLFCEANAYIYYDNEGVPVLDDFDEDENGSWWYMWPFGGRSINYRWMTEDRESYHYLYLQCNPVIWFSVFLAVVLSVAMFLMRIFGEHRFSSPDREWMFGAFLALYVCYMAAMAWVSTERVLYLYHYFLALVFGFFLLALCVLEIQKFFKWEVGIKSRVAFMAVLSGAMIASFVYYSPLTYYKPMLDQEVEKRALLHHWHLRPEEH
jgi:dolichyl-phosphate-mannose--protein O-mannosyl transferase